VALSWSVHVWPPSLVLAMAPSAPRAPKLQRLRPPPELISALGGACSFFVSNYRQMGPVYRFVRNGEEYTVLAGPEANQFFAQHGKRFLSALAFRSEQNAELEVEKHIVGMDGKGHARFRRLQKRGYSKPALHDKLDGLTEVVQQRVREWPLAESIELMPQMRAITARQLGLLIDTNPDDHLDDLVTFIRTMVVETVARTEPKKEIYGDRYLKAKERSMAFADDIIERVTAPRETRRIKPTSSTTCSRR
jgi:cytochrome P450